MHLWFRILIFVREYFQEISFKRLAFFQITKKKEAMYRVCVLPPCGKKILNRENFSPCFLSKRMHLLRLSMGLSEVFPSAVYVHKKNQG